MRSERRSRSAVSAAAKKGFVYMLKCADGTLYTGATTDIEKRVYAHNYLKSGAKYTKPRRPVKLAYSESFSSLRDAQKREAVIKKLSRSEKMKLVRSVSRRSSR